VSLQHGCGLEDDGQRDAVEAARGEERPAEPSVAGKRSGVEVDKLTGGQDLTGRQRGATRAFSMAAAAKMMDSATTWERGTPRKAQAGQGDGVAWTEPCGVRPGCREGSRRRGGVAGLPRRKSEKRAGEEEMETKTLRAFFFPSIRS
jgi:hypothetical protein